MLSVNNDYMQFDDTQILYVECQYDAHVNSCIEAHYDELASKIRLAGFDFVYIPACNMTAFSPKCCFRPSNSFTPQSATSVRKCAAALVPPHYTRILPRFALCQTWREANVDDCAIADGEGGRVGG